MKYFFAIFSISFLLIASLVTAEQTDTSNSLEIVKVVVITSQKGVSKDDLRILFYVKNISDSALVVLTKNLQHELVLYTDRPIELSLNLSSAKTIDGAKIIPSLYDFSPVTLKQGEIAEIEYFFNDKKNLKEIILAYDMLNEWSTRFNTWRGRVKSKTIKIIKFEK